MRRENCNLSKIFFLALCLVPTVLFSQSTLKGKIIDEITGDPIAFANVYLNNTTIGASTLENESFEIKIIPDGKYELTVSAMGYKKFQGEMEFKSTNCIVNISLKQDPITLTEIVIKPDRSEKKHFATFRKYFLGETSFASKCEIVNPDDLIFSYNKDTKVLLVNAQKEIVIDNKALGYRIYYSLDFFEFNYKRLFKKFQGSVRFENRLGMDHRDSVKCLRRREMAFNGSMIHFMKSLYNDRLRENGFFVSQVDSSAIFKSGSAQKEIDLNALLKGTSEKTLAFKGCLRVEYTKESEEPAYRLNRRFVPQTSYLVFRDSSIMIFPNGYFIRQLSVEMHGYFAWSEVLGESVPFDYNLKK